MQWQISRPKWSIPGWLALGGVGLIEALDWFDRGQSVFEKIQAVVPVLTPVLEFVASGWGRLAVLVFGLMLLALAIRTKRQPTPALTAVDQSLLQERLKVSEAVHAEIRKRKVFYDETNPNCYQPNGNVVSVVGEERIPHKETVYRIGVNGWNQQERHCRLVLQAVEPTPHDPGVHRLGLALKPRIPQVEGSEEFVVNPNSPAYVEILREVVPTDDPMHVGSRIQMVYVNDLHGQANWFPHGEYLLTFRLEGPSLENPAKLRVVVEYDGRRRFRCWRVREAA